MKKTLLLFFLSFSSLFAQEFRIVAVGDLHGDFDSTVALLKKAKVIDDNLNWIGGKTILVQTGDEIDRGDHDRKILDFFEKLKPMAQMHGGEVHAILGNHEIMNAELDFRFVFEGSWAEFFEFADQYRPVEGNSLDPKTFGRIFAFSPGGPYAKLLSKRSSVLKIHDILFVHGGLLPEYANKGIENLNAEVSNWLLGVTEKPDWFLDAQNPFWSRKFSLDTTENECALLQETLKITGSKFMVVSHTVQKEINSACDGLVYRIDVGISKYYGGPLQALEILPDSVNIIR